MCGFSGTHFRLAVFCLVIAFHDIRLANGCIHDEVDVDGWSNADTTQFSGDSLDGSIPYQPVVPSNSAGNIGGSAGQSNFQPSPTNQNQDGGSYRSTYPAVEYMPTFASPDQADLKPQSHGPYSQSRGPLQDVNQGSVYVQTFKPVQQSQKPSIDNWQQQQTSKSVQQIQRPSTNIWQQQGTSKSVQQNQQPSFSNWKTQSTASQQATHEPKRQNPNVATSNSKPQTFGSPQTIYRRAGQHNFQPSQTNQNQDVGSYRSTYPAVEYMPTFASPGEADFKPQSHGHYSLSKGPSQDVNHRSVYVQTFKPVQLSQKPSNDWQQQQTSKSMQQNQQPSFSNWKTQSTASQQPTYEPKRQNPNVATSNSKTQTFGSPQTMYIRVQSKETSLDNLKQQVSGSSQTEYKPVHKILQPSFNRGPESVQQNQQQSFDHSTYRSSRLIRPQSSNNWQQVSRFVTQSKGTSPDSWKQQASGSSENAYKPVQKNRWPYIINRKSQSSESVSPTYKPVQQNQQKSLYDWKQQASGSSQNAYKPVQKTQWLDQFLGSSGATSKSWQQKRQKPIYGTWEPLDSRPPVMSKSVQDDLQQSSFNGWKIQESAMPSIPDQSSCEGCQFKLDMSLVPPTHSGNRRSQNTHQDLFDQEDPNYHSAPLYSHGEALGPLTYPYTQSGNTHQDPFDDQGDSSIYSTLYNHGEASGPLAYLGEIKG